MFQQKEKCHTMPVFTVFNLAKVYGGGQVASTADLYFIF